MKFSYDGTNGILRVKAPQTLIIENKNLGYSIDYNLKSLLQILKKTLPDLQEPASSRKQKAAIK
ncbi:hypothetical protein [Chryseobacterium indoltheticum]|uniref:hypothetical protein n=1 Tax=Chryseobacterium indoltheticum TaxID=254 RepID=UPI003F490ACF